MISLKDIIYGKNELLESIISEVPVDAFEKIGDFEKAASFSDKRDRAIIKNEATVTKVKDFFKNTSVDFDFYFVNLPGRRKFAEKGIVDENLIFEDYPSGLGLKPEQLKGGKINEDHVTVFFVGNSAAEKTPLTAWTMAHRFGHVIRAGQRENEQWKYLTEGWIEKEISQILELYNKKPLTNRYDPSYTDRFRSYTKSKSGLMNQIGTMRSARLGKINRPAEFYYELFAQYLKDGKITLNTLQPTVKLGHGPYGRPEYSRTNNVDEVNEIIKGIERDFPYYAEDVLGSCVGNIYVM